MSNPSLLGLSLFWYLPLANIKEKPLKRQRRLGLLSVTEIKASDSLVVQSLNTLVFLIHGKRISLSTAIWDFSFSACLSHSRIKLLSQTVNYCYIYNLRNYFYNICIYKHFVETKTVFRCLENLLYSLWDKNYKNLNKVWLISTVSRVTGSDMIRSWKMYMLFSK